jgi:DNA polymerase III delta prime subunit
MLPSELPELLKRTLDSQRVHSGYLISGSGALPREAAIAFARGLVCEAQSGEKPCEQCASCHRSQDQEPPEIDATGKAGPLYRHIGDHPDLLFLDRGAESTRVRIGQIRAIQKALQLGSHEGGRRVVVIDEAQWLNEAAQNALLRVLEEPPDRTSFVLVTASAAALLATIRSRCQRVRFRAEAPLPLRGDEADDEVREVVERLDALPRATLPDLLEWAETYRGSRAPAALQVQVLLAAGSQFLRERVSEAVFAGRDDVRAPLDAFQVLASCRKDLDQRNANPQMIAEKAFLALQQALVS